MLVEIIAAVAASIGQFLDARTTEVALKSKIGRETNPVARFIIERVGFVGLYVVKAALFPAIGLGLHSTNTLFFISAFGVACATWNYFKVLRPHSLKIF